MTLTYLVITTSVSSDAIHNMCLLRINAESLTLVLERTPQNLLLVANKIVKTNLIHSSQSIRLLLPKKTLQPYQRHITETTSLINCLS